MSRGAHEGAGGRTGKSRAAAKGLLVVRKAVEGQVLALTQGLEGSWRQKNAVGMGLTGTRKGPGGGGGLQKNCGKLRTCEKLRKIADLNSPSCPHTPPPPCRAPSICPATVSSLVFEDGHAMGSGSLASWASA